jgi:hypothetical protein
VAVGVATSVEVKGRVVVALGLFYCRRVDPLRPLWRRLEPWLQKVRWTHWRAALLAAHIFAVVLVAFPAPLRKLDDTTWDKPSMRSELRNWSSKLQSVGIPATEENLKELVTDVTGSWQSGRKAVIGPFKAYLKLLAIPQNWYMFTGPDRAPQRFALAYTERGQLVRVFELGRSMEKPDLVDPAFLSEHRVRRALFQSSWGGRNGQTFDQICGYLGRRLRHARANIDDVVCQLLVQEVLHPSHLAPASGDGSGSANRAVTVARTLVLHRDGTTADSLTPKPKKRRQKAKKQ